MLIKIENWDKVATLSQFSIVVGVIVSRLETAINKNN